MPTPVSLSDFCVEKLSGKFKNAYEVAVAIQNQNMAMYFCAETKKPVIINDFMELGQNVYNKLPPEKKIVVVGKK